MKHTVTETTRWCAIRVKRKLLRDALNPEKVLATTKHTTDEQGRYSVTFAADEVAMKRLYVERERAKG